MYMFDQQSAVKSAVQSADCIADSDRNSSRPYQWVIHKKYRRHGHESPSAYEALVGNFGVIGGTIGGTIG